MQVNIFYNFPLPAYYKKTAKYKQIVLASLGKTSLKSGEVNIVFVNAAEILSINKRFLNHNYVTDVISFNYPSSSGQDAPFGDIFVCFEAAKKQASELGHSVLKELATLVAHGALHLVGWEDDTLEKRNKMNAKAEALAASVQKRAL